MFLHFLYKGWYFTSVNNNAILKYNLALGIKKSIAYVLVGREIQNKSIDQRCQGNIIQYYDHVI